MKINKVNFKNSKTGLKLAGLLFMPDTIEAKVPVVVVVGAMFALKEQAASIYARRMVDLGYAALVFDHSTYGQSEGVPRLDEDPVMKSEDIKSAVSYLSTLDYIDENRIVGLGICGGGGYLPFTAVSDRRIKAVASVVPFTSVREQALSGYGGLLGTGEQLLAKAGEARTSYAKGEPATYVPFIPENIGSMVEQYGDVARSVAYYTDPERGFHPEWKSEFLIWSADKQVQYSVTDVIAHLAPTPFLLITAANAWSREDAEKLFAMANEPKQFHLIENAGHFDCYDLEPYVTEAVSHIEAFYEKNLR